MGDAAPIESVTVVIFDGDKVLLVRNGIDSDHPTGVYGLPAGKVEVGETWEEAAVRECEEESGLKPLKLIKLPTFYEAELPRKNGTKKKFCCWSFLCTEYGGSLRITAETQPLWIKISEMTNLPLVVNVDKMVYEARFEYEKELNESEENKLRNLVAMQSCGFGRD